MKIRRLLGQSLPNTAKSILSLFCFLCVLVFTPSSNSANGQANGVLRLDPTPATFYLNGTQTELKVDLMADDVTDLLTYEFILTFNPAILEFVNITPGTWLAPVFTLHSEVSPGRIFFAYARLGPPGVNESGKLATLTFHVVGHGITTLAFSDPEHCRYGRFGGGALYDFDCQNGSLNATYDANSIKPVSVLGSVELQGRAGRGGAVMALSTGQFVGQGPYSATSTNAAGNNVSFSNVAMDLYRVTTNTPRYLNIPLSMNKQIALVGASTTIAPLNLIGGNAVWSDNEINTQDLGLVSGEFGKTSFIADADLNNDGAVDIFDLAIVAGNYGRSSAVEYAEWVP